MIQRYTLGLITQRSQVQILTPLPIARPSKVYPCLAFSVSTPRKPHRLYPPCRFALLLNASGELWGLRLLSIHKVGGHSKHASSFKSVYSGLESDIRTVIFRKGFSGSRTDFSKKFVVAPRLRECATLGYARYLPGNQRELTTQQSWSGRCDLKRSAYEFNFPQTKKAPASTGASFLPNHPRSKRKEVYAP